MEPLFRRLPGLSGIKGRYFHMAVLMVLTLMLSALLGRLYVAHTTENAVEKIRHRSEAGEALESVIRRFDSLEKRLERFILQPQQQGKEQLFRALDDIAAALHQLDESHRGDSDLLNALNDDFLALREAAGELIRTRLDVNLWFPVSVVMEEELLRENDAFTGAVESLIDLIEFEEDSTGFVELYRNAVELRHAWNRMTSEFRLYVANRFGVFSTDPMEGMASRAANIRLYIEKVSTLLNRLQQLVDRGDAGDSLVPGTLPFLRGSLAAWSTSYETVVEGVHRRDWRRDIVLLNQQIDPLIASLHQRMTTLSNLLERESNRDINLLTDAARSLSNLILLFAVAGTALIVLGYLMFDRTLLRPISQLTKALKAEAMGDTHGPLPPATVDETKDLLQAFLWMQKQVRERQSHLDHMAHHDALTGLPNRMLFLDRLEHALQVSERAGGLVAVLFLDLDHFKDVNDDLGHSAGDMLLVEVADRLRRTLRGSDTTARLSGDEFAVLMESIENREEITSVVKKLLEVLAQPFDLAGRQLRMSSSIGIAVGTGDDEEPAQLLRNADAAMYEAKRQGRNDFRYFSRSISDRATAFQDAENELRSALERDELPFLFHPVGTPDGSRVTACELMFCRDIDDHSDSHQERFRTLLEETGLIHPVAERALERIADLQLGLVQEGIDDLHVRFSLSARLLASRDFHERLHGHIRRGALRPERLALLVSENLLMKDIGAGERHLQRLRELGVGIELENFGTGLSSISHLRRFPFDSVSSDRLLLENLPRDAARGDMLRALVALSRTFGMPMIATGVENAEQAGYLERHGCGLIQGPYLSVPLESDSLIAFANDRRGKFAPARMH